MMHNVRYGLFFTLIVLGAQILSGCMGMMPFMMGPAVSRNLQGSYRSHEELIQKGFTDLTAKKGRCNSILLGKIETDEHFFSEKTFRKIIRENTAMSGFRILEKPVRNALNPASAYVGAPESVGLLDAGLFQVGSIDHFSLRLTDLETGETIWGKSLSGTVQENQPKPDH